MDDYWSYHRASAILPGQSVVVMSVLRPLQKLKNYTNTSRGRVEDAGVVESSARATFITFPFAASGDSACTHHIKFSLALMTNGSL